MLRNVSNQIQAIVKGNRLVLVLLAAALILSWTLDQPLRSLPAMVDWKTITTLVGLLLVTTGIEESGLLYGFAVRIVRKFTSERGLALFLVFFAAAISMVVTNDVALFILVPLTLALQRMTGSDGIKLVVFETIAVNVGSSLTPIGNPQNIYLWHRWGISFFIFVGKMLPLVAIMSSWLFFMTILSFPSRKIQVGTSETSTSHPSLFAVSAAMLVAFVVSIEVGWSESFLPVVVLVMVVVRRTLFLKCDWGLIILFVALFIDLELVSRIGLVRLLLSNIDFGNDRVLFLAAALVSQVMSNVPATLLLTKYSTNLDVIAQAVNVAGNGLAIASFANLIALRLTKGEQKYRTFHLYSLLFFLATMLSTFFLLI